MMNNKETFYQKLVGFIKSENRIALVKGYVNEEKLTEVLKALNNSIYNKGSINTRGIGNLKEIVDNQIIPKNITQNSYYRLWGLDLEINLYERKNIYRGDFSIYYPVQSALLVQKDTRKLIDHIKNNPTPKIFIITTNDWSFNTDVLEKLVDETIIYDLKQEDPESYKILYRNKNGDLPY